MPVKSETSKELRRFLKEESNEIHKGTEFFLKVLTNLRYEGKPSFGKNYKDARRILQILQRRWKTCLTIEEKVIYPFFQLRTPQLESAILLLRSENADVDRVFKKALFLFRKKSIAKKESKTTKWFSEIYRSGIYLIHLLRHHIRTSQESFFKTALNSLNTDEIRMLAERMKSKTAGFEEGVLEWQQKMN